MQRKRTLDSQKIELCKKKAAIVRRFLLELGSEKKIKLHYGGMFSCIEILVVLYNYWMHVDPKRPQWSDRDRFVLSKGHAAPALYGVLADSGYFPYSFFNNFRSIGSLLQGHPDRSKTPGVDCSTGSLGQGMPVACGMAMGSLLNKNLINNGKLPFRVFTLISDGECNEGSIWEAALIASNKHLYNLTVLMDCNNKSSYGPMEGRNSIHPIRDKWVSFGWQVLECNGHDFKSILFSLEEAEKQNDKPSIILCNTIKNKGIPYAEKHNMKSNYFLESEYLQKALNSLDEEVRFNEE